MYMWLSKYINSVVDRCKFCGSRFSHTCTCQACGMHTEVKFLASTARWVWYLRAVVPQQFVGLPSAGAHVSHHSVAPPNDGRKWYGIQCWMRWHCSAYWMVTRPQMSNTITHFYERDLCVEYPTEVASSGPSEVAAVVQKVVVEAGSKWRGKGDLSNESSKEICEVAGARRIQFWKHSATRFQPWY